tara:strand:- start:6351 stop:6635 length:285 start_codon:yes stop_codon:yes gene_type:complete
VATAAAAVVVAVAGTEVAEMVTVVVPMVAEGLVVPEEAAVAVATAVEAGWVASREGMTVVVGSAGSVELLVASVETARLVAVREARPHRVPRTP